MLVDETTETPKRNNRCFDGFGCFVSVFRWFHLGGSGGSGGFASVFRVSAHATDDKPNFCLSCDCYHIVTQSWKQNIINSKLNFYGC